MASSRSEVAVILGTAVAGIPQVAQTIAIVSPKNRTIAFDAAEQSYLQTARDLGCAEAEARTWVSAVMFQLRAEVDQLVKPIMLKSGAARNRFLRRTAVGIPGNQIRTKGRAR